MPLPGFAQATIGAQIAKMPIAGQVNPRSALVFERGSIQVKLYAPRDRDPQTPHSRDELYFIASGRGKFLCDGKTTAFGPGDMLFVAAGLEHRFLDFTDDIAIWVVFYGPEGGETEKEKR
jgi:mannose-6-phosphate isomerase-like protein (cupin superfamily)